jgi:Flp pilus assembly protein TadG
MLKTRPHVKLRNRRLRQTAREAGVSLVEYAFILILFLSIIMGISGFGHALFTYHHVNNAAKEGTRYATIRGYNCNRDETVPSCQASNSASGTAGPASLADVTAYINGITPPSIDTSKMKITACGVSDDTTGCTESGPTVCTADLKDPITNAVIQTKTPNNPGCTVKVTVSYPYTFMFPLVPATTTTTAPCTSAGFCMSSTSEMVIIH